MLRTSPLSIIFAMLTLIAANVLYVEGQTNNTLDSNGDIVWGELAPDKSYKTTAYRANTGGLDPYFNLAKSFIDTTLPEDPPVEKLRKAFEGEGDLSTTAKEVALDFIGIAICIAIGILFIIIFPIVCLCFCCCRCCGNCGGKRLQKRDPKARCKRVCFGISVVILSLFIAAGAACIYVSSDQITKNIGDFNGTFSDCIDDALTFVDNIDSQFNRLANTNFQFLKQTVDAYAKGAAAELSNKIVSELSNAVGLDAQLNNISTLSAQAKQQVIDLSDSIDLAAAQRNAAVSGLASFSNSCAGCLNNDINVLNQLDFGSMGNQADALQGKISTDVFKKMMDDINSQINSTVTSETNKVDVAGEMDKIYDSNLKPLLGETGSLRNTVEDFRGSVGDYVKLVAPYDKYRWYAGVGLASLILLVAFLALMGVLCGCCGSSAKDRPTERGSLSNCGGILLMSAVGIIFIFAALIMLLTTLMYIVGSLSERYTCETLKDFTKAERYLAAFNVNIANGFDVPFNNRTLTVRISALIDSCKQDQTLYNVLGLEGVVNDSLASVNDFKEKNLQFSFNATRLTKDIGTINVTSEIRALETSTDDLSTLALSIQNMTAVVNGTRERIRTRNQSAADQLNNLIDTLVEMEMTASKLNATTQNIKTEAGKLPDLINTAQLKLNDTNFMNGLISNVTNSFVNAIFGFVDSYLSDIVSKLKTDVAKCTPVYSVFNAIFGEAFCHGIVDPLNGFWLGLGWCIFFFMPTLILSVKLAKHFRRMLYDDDFDPPTRPGSAAVFTTGASQGVFMSSNMMPMRKNKVAPF